MSTTSLIQAAEDGLHIWQSTSPGAGGGSAAILLTYGQPVSIKREADSQQVQPGGLHVYGIIGVLPVGTVQYLIAITGREQVAIIAGNPVYTITKVLFIGFSSHSEARSSIDAAFTQQEAKATDDAGYASDESDHLPHDEHEQHDKEVKQKRVDAAALEPPDQKTQAQSPAGFGQFAQRWFSRSRIEPTSSNTTGDTRNTQSDPARTTIDTYRKRIVRTLRLYLTSRSFFYSHEYDLSRSVAMQKAALSPGDICRQFSEDVFWNKHLLTTFIQAESYDFAVPLIQGFVGQRTFTLPGPGSGPYPLKDVELKLTLISRRSTQRAGLRYLRRGVDERGNVANNVETEQILSFTGSEIRNTYSFVQVRGSIPLFFSQSPYSFKPLPQMYGSDEENIEAFRKHFSKLVDTYGDIQVASLVDKHGTEATIGQKYEEVAAKVREAGTISRPIQFHWFDFHKECSGMRFEKVSKLISTLEQSLRSFGCTVMIDGIVSNKQKGMIRTNCMDCLDRTNVTQSAISAWVLQQQLAALSQSIDLQSDKQSIWFNQLWADNGDAISKQYAGTAALKGDFTRTRKRNWTGALTDFSLTLNRFYNNIFGDYFLQTCIDYMLGEAGPEVFDNFETELSNQDHALDSDRIRRNAIDVCAKIVLEDADDSFTGWTLSCPASANTLRTMPFEECVLLLTSQAVYFCRFDWKSDKVGSFERIALTDLLEIRWGTYITTALGVAATDEQKNVGFILQYEPEGRPVVRVNTRTTGSAKAGSKASEMQGDAQLARNKQQGRFLAFKVPGHVVSNASHDLSSEREACQQIVNAIASSADSTETGSKLVVKEDTIVSLVEAQKSTSYADSISYSLKKLIW